MPSFKKRYDANKKKAALSLLKNFAERIKNGELVVESSGWWQGTPGQVTIRVTAKELDKSKLF